MLYPAELRARDRAIAAGMWHRQAALRAAIVLLACLLAQAPGAAELRLPAGRVVVPAGIELPVGEADALSALASAGEVRLEPEAPVRDRYGRLRAQLHTARGWVQARLVQEGLAVVAPAEDMAAEALTRLLALEREARTARRGLWAGDAAGPWPAERVGAPPWSYVLVQGRVAAAARTQDFVYLNFGRRWKEDFTLRADARTARRLERGGLDLLTLEGRNLLVRGLLFEADGPMIELVHEAQIEILP